MNKNFLCALFALSLLADSCFAAAKLVRDMKAAMSVADAERLLLQAKNMFADASGKDRTILHKLITTEGPAKIKSLEASAEQAEEDQKHAAELADLEVKIAAAAGGRGFDPAVAVIGAGSTDEEIEAKALYETMEAEKAAAAAGRKFDFDKELAKENRALVAQKEAAVRGPARDRAAVVADYKKITGIDWTVPLLAVAPFDPVPKNLATLINEAAKVTNPLHAGFTALTPVLREQLAKNVFHQKVEAQLKSRTYKTTAELKMMLDQIRASIQASFNLAQKNNAEADAAAKQANVATWVSNINQYFAPMVRKQTLKDVYSAIGNPLANAYAAAGCKPVLAGSPKLVDVATALNTQLGADLSTKVMGLRTLVGTQVAVNTNLAEDVDGVFTVLAHGRTELDRLAQPTGCPDLSVASVSNAIQAICAAAVGGGVALQEAQDKIRDALRECVDFNTGRNGKAQISATSANQLIARIRNILIR